ncbi:MAG: type III-B CRISPR module-associated protein Cmr5 [Methanothrix sp.]|jgi:CRISPR-associated protein Cmr5|nr:type III-B CRISPR module-associated protein Cmr5 [Methanothrix sp.]MDI9399185.1 type III-B CRISPR module-associated protein Cmr5 [Euryarchaeota archaeon]
MGNEYQPTREQKRAQAAYDCIKEVTGNYQEYVQMTKKFPALVHTCGLAQAVAFADAKDGDEYLKHLTKVMGLEGDLGERSRNTDIIDYQRYSREAMAAATWLKRYAEAVLE